MLACSVRISLHTRKKRAGLFSFWGFVVPAVMLMLTVNLAGCGGSSSGGGSSGGGSGSGTNTPTAEFLYASGISTVTVFSIDTKTGVPTQTSALPGANSGFDLSATPSGSFLYAVDDNNFAVDGFSVSGTGALSPLPDSPFLIPGSISHYESCGGSRDGPCTVSWRERA